MSDEAMIKEGQSPGKYSKTVPALLAAAAPRGDTIYAWNKTEENLCECSSSTSHGAAETEVKYGRRHERVMV